MLNIYKPPTPIPSPSVDQRIKVFLAGSIEMGKAEDWQAVLQEQLSELDIDIYNPRRDDWDSSWEQNKDNPPFREQVEWELEALDRADLIVMYLSPGTISPISLLELGLYAATDKLIVCCPEGFHRKGNVDIVCEQYLIPQVDTLEELVLMLKTGLKKVQELPEYNDQDVSILPDPERLHLLGRVIELEEDAFGEPRDETWQTVKALLDI